MGIKFQGTPKKPMRVGTVQTVDTQTGKVVEEKPLVFTVMPFRDDVCQECNIDHPHDQPHNQQSLGYQYRFYATHGRWPTWSDAMAHCSDEVKAAWRQQLVIRMREHGMVIPADLLESPKHTDGNR